MSAKSVSALTDMLRGIAPKLDVCAYEFISDPDGHTHLPDSAFALIKEDEGSTLVLAKGAGEQGHFARITLQVYSDLAGVGLTAAVSSALAGAGIACNVIAAFHHDHVFVPWERRDEAVELLQSLSAQKG
ncbi:MAG: ACT domain-containing protein [Pseudomonadota bacterium]